MPKLFWVALPLLIAATLLALQALLLAAVAAAWLSRMLRLRSPAPAESAP